MSLPVGTKLGRYEIRSKIGEGGMGEVYRATDLTLNGDVAIKVLPGTFLNDAERLARFQREAQVLASLNHTNIATIYGVEEENAFRALVMELVEGPTLAERIAPGPMPLDDALTIARQIAEALEAAHERGIIHRDLKLANVKITPEGTVQVLDFGLAKRFIGPYETTASIGAGGMGEVYRARDTELNRDVAIKVLPPQRRVYQGLGGRAQYAHIEDPKTDETILSHPNSPAS